MARLIKDSLALWAESEVKIRQALESKLPVGGGIPTPIKLSEVAGYIREIETKPKTASIKFTINTAAFPLTNLYITLCKGKPLYLSYGSLAFCGEIVQQNIVSAPNYWTDYTFTFEDVPLGETYSIYGRNSSNSGNVNPMSETYTPDVLCVEVTEAKEYDAGKLTLNQGVTSPPNPEEPWFEGMSLDAETLELKEPIEVEFDVE